MSVVEGIRGRWRGRSDRKGRSDEYFLHLSLNFVLALCFSVVVVIGGYSMIGGGGTACGNGNG